MPTVWTAAGGDKGAVVIHVDKEVSQFELSGTFCFGNESLGHFDINQVQGVGSRSK